LDPLTHLLTGACLGRAGFNRKTALATLTLAISAEIPDLDVVSLVKGPVAAFACHRGFTHTFLGVPFDAALTLVLVYPLWCLHLFLLRWWKNRNSTPPNGEHKAALQPAPSPAPRWGLLFIYGCIGALSHILLDFTNNYGVRPFWPFSGKWYSWDIVFIIEPLIWAALILGLVVPSLFGLIQDEISTSGKRLQFRGRAAAIAALLLMVALWGARDFEHRRAVGLLKNFLYDGSPPLRASAYPYPFNPFQWHGVVETKDAFKLLPVDSLAGEVDPQGTGRTLYKPEEPLAAQAAKRSYLGRVFLSWAQYPIIETEVHTDPADAYSVRFSDLRYAYPNRKISLTGKVELDQKLNVVQECFGQSCE
jgi:inner membrane protein